MGFQDYKCIDANGQNDALVFNLNEDLKSKGFAEQFDVVTNHGTTEHCFDQQNAFRNIHNLCAKGGIMLHGLPFQGYLNHGFYNYHPNFYSDLAIANGYELIGLFVNIDADAGDLSSYSSALMKHLSMSPLSTTALFAVLRKVNDEEFRTPFQGKFAGDAILGIGYEFKRIPSVYFDLAQIAWEMSSMELARILGARVWRKFTRMLGFR
jgi:SAM-dependent methyltransferase